MAILHACALLSSLGTDAGNSTSHSQVAIKVSRIAPGADPLHPLVTSLRQEMQVVMQTAAAASPHLCHNFGFTVQGKDAFIVRQLYRETLSDQLRMAPGVWLGEMFCSYFRLQGHCRFCSTEHSSLVIKVCRLFGSKYSSRKCKCLIYLAVPSLNHI